MYPGWPINDPVDINDPLVQEFANQIRKHSPLIEASKITEPLPIGNCYWNVDETVKRLGGKMVTGWLINKWTNSHLVGMHHAIYVDPNGTMLDITQSPPCETITNTSIFLIDNSHNIDTDKVPAIGSLFYVLNENPFTTNYIESYKNLNQKEKNLSKVMYSVGIRCESNKAIANGTLPTGIPLTVEQKNLIENAIKLIEEAKIRLGTSIEELKKHTGHS
ncbi:hypothetical protein LBP97_06345 [Serratia marcescens]|nr:hypothetical protein LBP97_06345 [Serratia marcescens]